MERTQVYLSEKLKKRIKRYAMGINGNLSEVIRFGMERFLDEEEKRKKKTDADFQKVMKSAFGMWKDRDPKEFEENRRSWDRRLDEWGV